MVIKVEQKDGTTKEYPSLRVMMDEENKARPLWEKLWEDWVYYPLYRGWNNHVKMWPKELKWFWQRGNRGYSDCDVWGFDEYLAKVIIGGVSQLRNTMHGCPLELAGKSVEEGCKEWANILTKIQRAFELNLKQIDWEKLTEDEEKERQEGLKLFCYWCNNLWD